MRKNYVKFLDNFEKFQNVGSVTENNFFSNLVVTYM